MVAPRPMMTSPTGVQRFRFRVSCGEFHVTLKPAPRTPQLHPRSHGFTLIELIIVLAILAVVMGTLWPRFDQAFAQMTLTQATDTLVSRLRYAHTRAIAERQLVQVVFDPTATPPTHTVKTWEPRSGTWESRADRFSRTGPFPRGTRLSLRSDAGAENTTPLGITFYPNGQAEAMTITLQSPTGQIRTVIVEAATGDVHAP